MYGHFLWLWLYRSFRRERFHETFVVLLNGPLALRLNLSIDNERTTHLLTCLPVMAVLTERLNVALVIEHRWVTAMRLDVIRDHGRNRLPSASAL